MSTQRDEVAALIDRLGKDMSLSDYVDFLEEIGSDVEMKLDAARSDLEREGGL